MYVCMCVMGSVNVPFVVLVDSAFRLSTSVMKPYPFRVDKTESQKKFNYTLSKCRRVVENAFGHLKVTCLKRKKIFPDSGVLERALTIRFQMSTKLLRHVAYCTIS